MTRILFWIALIVLVVMAVRAKLRGMTQQPGPGEDAARRGAQAPAQVESMSRCAHCGVYFPASEAVRADGLDYCSPAHVRLPAKQG
ncbi:MAG: PP0621 family protein [Telluria sp.]